MTTARPDGPSPLRSHPPRPLISRIAAPFSPRPRYITDLTIETANPRRVYSPGDSVRGSVNFTAHKPIKLTHLVVQIHGFVKVYKNAMAPGEGIPAEASAVSSFHSLKGIRARGNGYARIFEKEQVLCGHGTLNAGRYEVPFDIRFPEESLPSSIDFERGTISYVLSTVLTRPTTVVPTMVHEQKIDLEQTIDVSSMNIPKQCDVSLKPIARRPRGRTPGKADERDALHRLPRPASRNSDEQREARSPSMSEQSVASALSNGSGLRYLGNVVESEQASLTSSEEGKTITATVTILREGYLAGDLVPIRIVVKHVKPTRAMQGIIVTLYRRGRIDAPAVLDNTGDNSSGKDDYLPQSRTGLGGLFASAGFSRNYRYDLSQAIEPMIVNPSTMLAEVRTTVRIPEDIFPSVTCVPHNLIKFTYHVEVVMDLRGKLSATDRFLPRLSMTRTSSDYELGESHGFRAYDSAGAPQSVYDTVAIRRFDSIAHCVFDIVVGTKDSHRKVAKKTADPWTEAQRMFGYDINSAMDKHSGLNGGDKTVDRADLLRNPSELPPQTATAAAPDLEADPPVSEKERIRRYEEQLLPSHPPPEQSSSSGYSAAVTAPLPSDFDINGHLSSQASRVYRNSQGTIRAPLLDQESDISEKEQIRRHEASLLPGEPSMDFADDNYVPNMSSFEASAPSAPFLEHDSSTEYHHAPSYPYAAASASSHGEYPSNNHQSSVPLAAGGSVPDDKAELQRRELLNAASEPDYEIEQGCESYNGSFPAAAPSAPVLELDNGSEQQHRNPQHDQRGIWEGLDGVEHLPRYQR